MYEITPRVAMFVAAKESVVREMYYDSVNVPTWGIGITKYSGHSVERYKRNPQTLEKCLEIFVWALGSYAKDLEWAFDGQDLSEHELAAALSFHYNSGGARYKAEDGSIKRASWIEKHVQGDRAGAHKAFMNWSRPSEIIPRRKAERDLFFSGEWKDLGTHITEWPVTSSLRPDWRRGRRVEIMSILTGMLGGKVRPDPQSIPTENVTAIELVTGIAGDLKRLAQILTEKETAR